MRGDTFARGRKDLAVQRTWLRHARAGGALLPKAVAMRQNTKKTSRDAYRSKPLADWKENRKSSKVGVRGIINPHAMATKRTRDKY